MDSEIVKYVVQASTYLRDDGDEVSLLQTRLTAGQIAGTNPSILAQLQALVSASHAALQAALELAVDTDHVLYLYSAISEYQDTPMATRIEHIHKEHHDPEEN